MKKLRLLMVLVALSVMPAACTSPVATDCDEVACHEPGGGNHEPGGGN